MLIDVNCGCFVVFCVVYECVVLVIVVVNGFCVGGGIGLVGNFDVIVVFEDVIFGLFEVEWGVLGVVMYFLWLVF